MSALFTIPYRPEPVIIDLTGDDDDEPILRRRSPSSRPEGPPAKRQRIHGSPPTTSVAGPSNPPLAGPAERPQPTPEECFEVQLMPVLRAECMALDAELVDVEKVANELRRKVFSSNKFKDEYERSGGWLSTSFLKKIKVYSAYVAQMAQGKDEFRREPAPSVPPQLREPIPVSSPKRATSPPPKVEPPTPAPAPASTQPPPRPRTPLRLETRRPAARTNDSPQNYRLRARVRALRSAGDGAKSKDVIEAPITRALGVGSTFFALDHRPYYKEQDRKAIALGTKRLIRLKGKHSRERSIYHVDFTDDEIKTLQVAVRDAIGLAPKESHKPIKDIRAVVNRNLKKLSWIPNVVAGKKRLPYRNAQDIYDFLSDVVQRHPVESKQILSLEQDELDTQNEAIRASRVPSLLFARELVGNQALGRARTPLHFNHEFLKAREDGLELQAEWTNCAGDVSTLTWVGNHNFICGTTAHMDSHNQQYNKMGNLLLGSASLGKLQAYPDHRIVRPIVQKGSNATDAMRQSQDPWLYASVVSSDYDAAHDRAYTSSFDKTVKVWRVDPRTSSMAVLGTWQHNGNVNFVLASKHPAGFVATASDVPTKAVRVYQVDEDDINDSPFVSFPSARELQDDVHLEHDKWAYYPATAQWGRSPDALHLLLVGYSPRSLTMDENEIPEDKRNSGELSLWNCLTRQRVRIMTASNQNVFEVAWHPTQASFIAATAPVGLNVEDNVRTQIRVFKPSNSVEFGRAYAELVCLDCTAADINELTVMPNSFTHSYVTAASTEGRVYVWDTAQGDKPIHVLTHGDPCEELAGEREREDTGVKFTAWGTTPDRFYTGSSDGVVKIWNVRRQSKPLVRDLLEVSAQVICGAFSPDHSRLAIGDASGRVFLLSLDKNDQMSAQFVSIRGEDGRPARTVRRPQQFAPHPEPPPPPGHILDETGVARAQAFLRAGKLVLTKDPVVGAVQGPNYADLGLYCRAAHLDDDPTKPLLAADAANQRRNAKMYGRRPRIPTSLTPVTHSANTIRAHHRNKATDLDPLTLPEETQLALKMARVDLRDFDDVEENWDLEYEELPSIGAWGTDTEEDQDEMMQDDEEA